MSDDPYGNLHPLLRPSFPFFNHRTMAEVAEVEKLEGLRVAGKIFPYQMVRLRELAQKVRAY